ncbi:MAG TPA: hypothetical protein PLA77_07960, partial [Bacteroidales bacterium]|nr:hypothetical protein [Bacteroidales bacterium]
MTFTRKLIPVLFALLTSSVLYSQQNVGISNVPHTPHGSSVLDVYSTDKGMLIPRMTSLQRMAIVN